MRGTILGQLGPAIPGIDVVFLPIRVAGVPAVISRSVLVFRCFARRGERLISSSASLLSLEDLGWRASFARALEHLADSDLFPGRIVLQQRGRYALATATGEITAALASRFRAAADPADLPCVGDWVAVRAPALPTELGSIVALLPRISKLSRRASGADHTEQILAANIDTIFIAMGLDGDFNLHRLERYLAVADASGGRPVVLLTKADLCPDENALAARIADARASGPTVNVVAISVIGAPGVRAVERFLIRGETIVMLGSSGAGKSTLVNALLEEEVLRTGEVRASDSQGRHTTTQRQLFRLSGGALVIDTPGIRDLRVWEADAGARAGVTEVDQEIAPCHFRDCRHGTEPGCVVRDARTGGRVAPEPPSPLGNSTPFARRTRRGRR
jgi:ribosome biogenesis GTPase